MDNEPTPTLEAAALLRELVENWASETFVPATYPALTPGNADFTRAVEEKTNAVMGKFNALVIMMASNAEDEQIASALRHAVRTCVRDLIVPENSTLNSEIDELIQHAAQEHLEQQHRTEGEVFPTEEAPSATDGGKRGGGANLSVASPSVPQEPNRVEQLLTALVESQAALMKGTTTAAEKQHDQEEENNQFLHKLRKITGVQKPTAINMAKSTLKEFGLWVDKLLVFLQHVDSKSKGLATIINKLKTCCYASGIADSEERHEQLWLITTMAETNYANLQFHLPTGDKDPDPPSYTNLTPQQVELDKQIFVYVFSLLQAGASGTASAELHQYNLKVQEDESFGSFVELILYGFYTKSKPPVYAWLNSSARLDDMPYKISAPKGASSMDQIEGEMLQTISQFMRQKVQPWQRAAAKAHEYFVSTGFKRAAGHFEKAVNKMGHRGPTSPPSRPHCAGRRQLRGKPAISRCGTGSSLSEANRERTF